MSASKNSSPLLTKATGSASFALNSHAGMLSSNTSANLAHKIDWQADEDLFYKSRAQIADFFRKHRLLSNLSLEQVRESLELDSIVVVSAYENGERSIPLEDLFALTNLLNIPPEEVLALVFDTTSPLGLR